MELAPLLFAAVSVAFFHALAPDHWVPFVALAKSSRWSMRKLAWVTTLAGTGHVVSSLVLGLLGLWAGLAVHRLEGAEAWRGSVGIWLLIGFGVAYALWGFKHAQHHHPHDHPHVSVQDVAKTFAARRVWMLFAIMVFGPCEPLIPLMFLAAQQSMPTVWAVSIVFSLVTIGMVVGQSLLGYAGARLIKAPWMERYAHALAGLVILLTAVFVLVAGV
jgi:nickel/cobalt transporter (NicO) family protein